MGYASVRRGGLLSLFVSALVDVDRCYSALLLNLLLLTRQSVEHGAVQPKQNELPSFHERRGLSIVPTESVIRVDFS